MVSAIACGLGGADGGPGHAALDHRPADVEVEDLPDRGEDGQPHRLGVGRLAGGGAPDGADAGVHALDQPLVDGVERARRLGHLAQHEAGDQPRLGLEQQEADHAAAPAPSGCARRPAGRRAARPRGAAASTSPISATICSAQASRRPFLAAEMVGDRRDVGARRRGDLADAGRLEALLAEAAHGGLDDGVARRPAAPCVPEVMWVGLMFKSNV